jgi:PAS domain S-box-containing protein
MRGDGITKTRFPGPATLLTQDKKEGEVGKTGGARFGSGHYDHVTPAMRFIGSAARLSEMFNLPPVVVKRALRYSALCVLVSASATIGFGILQHPELETFSPALWLQLGSQMVINTLLAVFVFWLLIRASRIQAELEAAQRKSDARFRHLVDEASELLLTLDAAGQVVYASEAVRTLLGRTPVEVQGQLLLNLVTEADRALAVRMLALVSGSARELHRFPLHLKSASGGARLVEILARNLLDHADVSAVLLHCRDITAEHRLVQEKHRIKDRMKQALAAGRLGSFEWNLRTDEIHPDQTFCSHLGLGSERNLIAKEDLLARLREEERQDLLAAVATARAKAGAVEARFSLLNADGRSRTLELHAQFHADPQTAEVTQLFGFVQDITERTEMLQRIGRYAAFPMLNPNPVLEFDAEGKVTLANEATRTVCAECQMVPADFLPANFAQLVTQVVAGQGVRQAYELKRAERNFGITLSATAGVPSFRCYVMDLTEHFRTQQDLAAANRALRMLVDCNQIIKRLDSEQELLEQVCRLIVGEGGYRMAWVGYAEQDAEKTVRPMAWAGAEEGYLSMARITWADSDRGQGPTGTAIRTRLPQICRDIAIAPHFAPWREAALQRGYRSSGVFPLVHENVVLGTLNMYSAEVNRFDEEESKLLAELAGDLALGLGLIRMREGRQAAERGLAETAERLALALHAGNLGIYDLNVQTGEAVVNPEYALMLGYDPADFHETNAAWLDRLHPEDRELTGQILADYLAGKRAEYRVEFRQRTRTGEYKWLLSVGRLIERDAAGQPRRMIGTHADITARKLADAALQASEREFRSLAESMPQIVWITRPDGWNIYFNQQWVDYTGLTLEESYGHGWNKPFHPDDQQRAWEAWQNATQHSTDYSIECRLRRADGTYRWWLIRGVPQRDASGQILKWFGTCTDIEDIKRAEAAFATFFEQPMGLNLICTLEGQIQQVNQSWELMLGRDRQAAIGANLMDFIHPDDRAATTAELAKLAQGATTFHFENRYRHQDGSFRTLSWSAIVSEQTVYGMAVDVTEARQSQQHLKLQAAMLANLEEGINLCRARDGLIIETNPQFDLMFGYARGELIGQSIAVLNASGARSPEAMVQEIMSALAARGSWSGEVENVRKDGTRFWCRASVGVFEHREDGKVWVSAQHDITERKRAEQVLLKTATELQARNDLLARFNRVAVDREVRMVELKGQINDLCQKLGEPPRYSVAPPAPGQPQS